MLVKGDQERDKAGREKEKQRERDRQTETDRQRGCRRSITKQGGRKRQTCEYTSK